MRKCDAVKFPTSLNFTHFWVLFRIWSRDDIQVIICGQLLTAAKSLRI